MSAFFANRPGLDRSRSDDNRVCGRSNRALRILLGGCLAALGAAAGAGAAEALDDPAALGALSERMAVGAQVFRTDHFAVVSAGNDGQTFDLRRRLEGLWEAHQRWAEALELPTTAPGERLLVGYLTRHRDFEPLRKAAGFDRTVAGFFDEDRNWTVLFDLRTDPRVAENVQRVEALEADLLAQIKAHQQEVKAYRHAIAQLKAQIVYLERARESDAPVGRGNFGNNSGFSGGGDNRNDERDDAYYDDEILKAQRQLDQLEQSGAEEQFVEREAKLKQRRAEIRAVKKQVDRIINRMIGAIIHHEAAHAIQFNLGVLPRQRDLPPWLVEGLAGLFEDWSPANADPVEHVNRPRAAYVREIYGQLRSLPPLDEVIAGRRPREMTQRFQSLAWALVYYLSQAFPDAWPRYLREMGARPPASPAEHVARFEVAFGTLDGGWRREFHRFLLRLPTQIELTEAER